MEESRNRLSNENINLCEENCPKTAKISKNWKSQESYLTNSVGYNNLRRLGNSEVLFSNP